MLLAILGGVLLALAGIGPRARLVAIIALIAVYVPLAGAGPSIQRAGVMGAAGILAGLAGRPADRAYLPLLAAAATLLLNPYSAGEIGWQLSFAAVIGIALWAAPIRDRLEPRLRGRWFPSRIARPLAEGIGLTLAATLATAPLMALHFETVSLASLPANVVVLVAVAPVMWLGMLAALIGQLPLIPTAPLALLEGPLLDFIAAVAAAFSRPHWAVLRLTAPSPATIAMLYLALVAGLGAGLSALRRRDGHTLAVRLRVALAAAATLAVATTLLGGGPSGPPIPSGALRVTALDVGQGDAILLARPSAPAVLVDTGPPGSGVADSLREAGVRRLAAIFISHDQLDHAGALPEVLRSFPVERLALARPAPDLVATARSAGVRIERVGEGSELRFGALRVQVLAPRSDAPPAADPNADSMVLAASFAGWTTLLTGDAEAEASSYEPGPFDVLKLAHHGSADAGLGALLDRSAPRVALIGVGAYNGYGHPTPETLAELSERGLCVLRTDLDGAVWAELAPGSLRIGSERDAGEDRCRI